MKPVTVSTIQFATQAAATKFFRAMLNSYTPDDTVSAQHLAALLERHPEYAQKIGCRSKKSISARPPNLASKETRIRLQPYN
jgi:Protein of unknown function (DUF3223)